MLASSDCHIFRMVRLTAHASSVVGQDFVLCSIHRLVWEFQDASCSLGFLHKWHELCAPVSASMVSALVSKTHKLH